MITSINIKNVASYDSDIGVEINNLKTVNYFFGFNGTGKSTIAKYLKNISLESSSQSSQFLDCSNVGYDNEKHQLLVFNDDFVEENFNQSQDFKGVFSLNQTNTKIDQQIIKEESNILNYVSQESKHRDKLNLISQDRESKRNALLERCWSKRTIFSTFSKISLPHSGSKPNFLEKIRTLTPTNSTQIPTLEYLTKTYLALYEKDLKRVELGINVGHYLAIIRIERKLEKLLNKIIIGNEDVDISGLIKSLNSNSWVEQGLTYLDKSGNVCPFCQQGIIEVTLKEQFDKFFDDSYKSKIAEIKNLKQLYFQKLHSFVTDLTSIQDGFNPDNRVSKITIVLNKLLDNNLSEIEDKLSHSNKRKSITSINSTKKELIEILKAIIDNNQLYDDYSSNKDKLLENISLYIAVECQTEILDLDSREIRYTRIMALAKILINEAANKISNAKQNIELLRSQTLNTKDAVERINFILKNSGFDGFEIAEKERMNNISRYFLVRPNSLSSTSVFQTLSEGEKNFISFLYFYQSCLGTDDLNNNGSKKKIIVIDDPVSSLDSQALFIVSTLIHSLLLKKEKPNGKFLKNSSIEQILVLTHNFYFYKEVSNDKRPICNDFWHFRITKVNNHSKIIGTNNKTIYDDYSMLWKTIKEFKDDLPENSMQNITIANSMRRIIETYVSFNGLGINSWAAILTEDNSDPNYYIKSSFISIINDESHKVSALDSIYYHKITNYQPQILFDVFESIFKIIGKEHYDMKMSETTNG